MLKDRIKRLEEKVKDLTLTQSLTCVANEFPGKVVFSTSFGMEDQVITDAIAREKVDIEIFTLDTGRLFNETYEVFSKTMARYKKRIVAFYPDAEEIQQFVSTKGINSFYESVENRKECCRIRKIEPLKRALSGSQIWVTGIRAEQSPNRQNFHLFEWDENFNIIKFNPLLHWKSMRVREYINNYKVPYNYLHDKGFLSIGCAPCTRAIEPGEDERAGRWWWEDSKKECGLHSSVSSSQ
ncbi:phosphoadenylyl-sulfate reductase [Solitalea koreensis]|uniref:Adenosine 5'-phosphosulfate reductase n=1 Tax=Solitalea koreensis TaxID=543615 RepID=A0A521D8H7_9SPHI|nr:phosphoadenylyl-sulfate reductase [Solitalea koreensis]SMO67912.1 phosphoadenylylsulfate reductase (thioredoxin) [Solitalea koreensis]